MNNSCTFASNDSSETSYCNKIAEHTIAFFVIAVGAFSLLTVRDEEGKLHFVRTPTVMKKLVKRIVTPNDTISPFSQLGKEVNIDARTIGRLSKTIFGFYPHWMGDYYHQLPYELLTHVAYFSYEVDPATGSSINTHQWLTTQLIEEAHHKGVKAILVATLFGSENNRALLTNTTSRQTLIDSLISIVKQHNGDGINIDFEIVPSSLADSLTAFMRDLSVQLKHTILQSHLSIDIPATDRNEAFDIAALNQICDNIIIMGYDYYYSGSGVAGPVAPLTFDGTWRKEHVKETIDAYIKKGASPEKILLGIPFYGYEWTTEADTLGSSSISAGKPRFYSSICEDTFFNERKIDSHSNSVWMSFQRDNKQKQVWFDDSTSLSMKYEHVDTTGLSGIAIWALGYEGGHQEIWNGIVDAFVRVDKIDFERSFTLPNNLLTTGAEGINYKSQVQRIMHTADNHCLQIDIVDSINTAHSWFIPIELHNVMVVPQSGVITIRTRGTAIPKQMRMYCELEFKGKKFTTASKQIFANSQWTEHQFTIPSLIDTNEISLEEFDRHNYITLKRICVEAPGNSASARLQIDDITTKTFPLPQNSFVRYAQQNENQITIDCLIDGKEIQSFVLQRYNNTLHRWVDRVRKNLNRSQIFDGTMSDSLPDLGTYSYRILASDTKRNSFEMDNWDFHNYPEIQFAQNTPVSDSLSMIIAVQREGLFNIALYDERGIITCQLKDRMLKQGSNTIQTHFTSGNGKTLMNGIYYLKLSNRDISTTHKLLVNR